MLRIVVPATSANMGPGFDAVGMAVTLYNTMEVALCGEGVWIADARGKTRVQPSDNLIVAAMQRVFERAGWQPAGLEISCTCQIPSGRGLGSSAACIAGAMTAANALLPEPFEQDALIYMAAEMEGHPDNVLPAFLGGVTVGVMDEGALPRVRFMPPGDLSAVAMVPSFEMMTAQSRGMLPDKIGRCDAVASAGRAALLTASLISGQYRNLRAATDDWLHQPYRKPLIPHWDELFAAGYENGAHCVYLSGAGPALMALCERPRQSALAAALLAAAESFAPGVWRMLPLDICPHGVRLDRL